MRVRLMGAGASYGVDGVGVFRPAKETVAALGPGEIGFLNASIKQVRDARVGDTITEEKTPHGGRPAGLQTRRAGGVLRPVPGGFKRV